MKYLIALFLLTSSFFASQNAQAMVKIDSVYADSIYYGIEFGALNVTDPIAALGKPNGINATFTNSTSTLDLGFRNSKHTALLPIKQNSKVIIWGKKDPGVDTSAGQVIFVEALTDGTLIRQTKPIVLNDGPDTLIVPSGGSGVFTFMEFSLAGSENGGGAKSYFLDAIALLQDTLIPVSVNPKPLLVNSVSSYPNPFVANTTIRFELQTEGEIQIAVIDGLGRQVDYVNAGYLSRGVHDIPLTIKSAGMYFIRLYMDGQPIGNPLKITSR